jgi:diguanylate cyclase (GGDEF)-like protein
VVSVDDEPTARPIDRPWQRVVLLSSGLLLAVVALSAGMEGAAETHDQLHLSWWMLIVLFGLAEAAVVPVYMLRASSSQFSFSLTELPLVLGLVFADAWEILLARVVAGLVVMYLQGQRDATKYLFNGSLFAFEAAVALFIYRQLFNAPNPDVAQGWIAIFAAMSVVTVLGVLLVAAAMSIDEGVGRFLRYPRMLQVAGIAGSVNTSLGLLATIVIMAEPRAGWLLLVVSGLLFVAYRGYTSLSDKHESLVLLQQFTHRVSRILEHEAASEQLLREAMTLLRVAYAELVTVDEGDGGQVTLRVVRSGDPGVQRLQTSWVEHPLHQHVTAMQEPVLMPRSTRDPLQQRVLAARGLADAVIVPLGAADGPVGTLCLGGRLGLLSPFTADDVRLCQTVANHASILLENGRLVDRLRDEVAEKEHQASHDALTSLPNRTMFHDRLQQAVIAARDADGLVGVILLDLDRFKEVNDTLGHHIGDELLLEVGNRLRRSVKSGDTVARLGGDEFAILLPSVRHAKEARAIAERARRALEQPFDIGALTLVVGASLGIALAPDHGEIATVLLQRADVAMYAAKASHAGVVVYTADVDTHSPRRLALVGDLRRAIAHEELLVHFQPKADVRTGDIIGAEALVRWLHPTDGYIPPDEFIPIAERTGMIHDLTAQVLNRALEQCAAWRRGGRRIDVAVNVSASSLLNLDFPDEVRRLLTTASVAPSSLTLEITESSIMADPIRSIRVLSALSATGVQLAIDDFGTGYSSLSQLKQLPVDELKIDRSFIMDMVSDDDDATIVRSTIDLGHNLGLRLVAEGVEDRETWRRLGKLGCDVAQGYYLSPALDGTAFDAWLLEWEQGIEQRILPPVDERARSLELAFDHRRPMPRIDST